jgi:hypothetical protein
VTGSSRIANWRFAGGFDFAGDPRQTSVEQPIYWSPNTDTHVLVLTDLPTLLDASSPSKIDITVMRENSIGRHAVHATEALTSHLILLPRTTPDAPLAALVPLDNCCLDRIEALIRLWQSCRQRAVIADTRITAQQRSRLRLMLQAIDGRDNGASYRQIANTLYGEKRVADDPWKTSALRDSTIELVRGGLALVAGGYRQLLRHRRRV